MFDRTYVTTGPSVIDVHAHITEKRAPTDESVRLLREMEQKAREEVSKTIRLQGNGFNCVVHRYDCVWDDALKFVVTYDVNGKRCETRYSHIQQSDKKTEFVNPLIEALAKDIAHEILGGCAKDLFRAKW